MTEDQTMRSLLAVHRSELDERDNADADQWYELIDEEELQAFQPLGSRWFKSGATETWEQYRLCARFSEPPDSKWVPCDSPTGTP